MKIKKRTIAVMVFFLPFYGLFLIWYGGKGSALSPQEADTLLLNIQRKAGVNAFAPESGYLNDFRDLVKSDDGNEYYMVNLIKYRAQAQYPADSPYANEKDSAKANERYSAAIVPILLKHGGIPVFNGMVQGKFIHSDGDQDWDMVGMVRYRSRRDMLSMAADIAGLGIDVHKWASIEKTEVFPVKPVLSLAFIRASVGIIVALLGILANYVLCLLPYKAKRPLPAVLS